jgi:PGF-CTERM protein
VSRTDDRLHPALPVVVAVIVALATVAPAATASVVPRHADTDQSTRSTSPIGPQPRVVSVESTEHRGDLVSLAVTVPNESDTAALRIEGPRYDARYRLRDTDGDHRIDLTWNTYNASESSSLVVHGDDNAVLPRVRGAVPLDAGTYEVSVSRERGGDPTDTASLDLRKRGASNLTTYTTGNHSLSDLQSPTALQTAVAGGEFERLSTPTVGADGHPVADDLPAVGRADLLVFRWRVDGFSGALAERPGDSATQAFVHLVTNGTVTRNVRQTNPDPSVNPRLVHLWPPTGATVVPDPANDTYYVVVDLDRVFATHEGDEPTYYDGRTVEDYFSSVLSGERYNATVSFSRAGDVSRQHFVVTEYEVTFASLDRDDRTVTRVPEEPVVLRGQTNLPTGRTATVVLDVNGSDTVLRVTVTPSGSNGTFVAVFDPLPEGTTATLDVRYNGQSMYSSYDPLPTVRISDGPNAESVSPPPTATDQSSTHTPSATQSPSPTSEPPPGTRTATTTPGFGVVVTLAGLSLAAFAAQRVVRRRG